MKRLLVSARPDYNKRNSDLGFDYNLIDGQDYWTEDVCYELTSQEVDKLEAVTQDLHDLMLKTVQRIIDEKLYHKLYINPKFIPSIERSWEQDLPTLYGRMDLAYDGISEPKLLEYNADTPTSLVESAVVQYYWMVDQFKNGQIKNKDQFNSVHEKFIDSWKNYKQWFMEPNEKLYFAYYGESQEDYRTVEYMADTALQAGIENFEIIPIESIGFDSQMMINEKNETIKHIFKLYPYEWMMNEPFSDALLLDNVNWLEPVWKSMVSNKAFLALMYEFYPDHPNLLPTYFSPDKFNGTGYVEKPIFGREGANIKLVSDAYTIKSEGLYDEEPKIYQKLNLLPQVDGYFVQFGSWIVNNLSAGVCIREDISPIICNKSRFVPHYFV